MGSGAGERTRNEVAWLCEAICSIHRGKMRNGKRETAVGRGEIRFGCDEADMHVTVRNVIQRIGR